MKKIMTNHDILNVLDKPKDYWKLLSKLEIVDEITKILCDMAWKVGDHLSLQRLKSWQKDCDLREDVPKILMRG